MVMRLMVMKMVMTVMIMMMRVVKVGAMMVSIFELFPSISFDKTCSNRSIAF